MKNKIGLLVFLLLSFSALLTTQTACYYDNETTLYPGGGACDTAEVRYAVEVKKIMTDRACYVCHSTAAANGGITLEGYASLKKAALDGSLIGSVRWASGYSQMPKNANQITECELQKLEKWVAEGALDN